MEKELIFAAFVEKQMDSAVPPITCAVIRKDSKFFLRLKDSEGREEMIDFTFVPDEVFTLTNVRELYRTNGEFKNYVDRS